jgi:hypothetical protein
VFAALILDILDYKNTNKYTTITNSTGYVNNNATANENNLAYTGGVWNDTAVVNEIQIYKTSGNWSEDSIFALYGIKGE